MMASVYTPLSLSPVGYGVSELHRLLIDFQVQTFTYRYLLLAPCPNHYDGRLVTMASADFYSITIKITPYCAIGFHLFALLG